MGKKRMIDMDGLCYDGELVDEVDLDGCFLYARLWSIAEDSGCIFLDARQILFQMGGFQAKYSKERIQEILNQLIKLKKIIPYNHQGKQYGWLKNFPKHQKLNFPTPPTLPLPPWIKWHPKQSPKDPVQYYEFLETTDTSPDSSVGESSDESIDTTVDTSIDSSTDTSTDISTDGGEGDRCLCLIEEKRNANKSEIKGTTLVIGIDELETDAENAFSRDKENISIGDEKQNEHSPKTRNNPIEIIQSLKAKGLTSEQIERIVERNTKITLSYVETSWKWINETPHLKNKIGSFYTCLLENWTPRKNKKSNSRKSSGQSRDRPDINISEEVREKRPWLKDWKG